MRQEIMRKHNEELALKQIQAAREEEEALKRIAEEEAKKKQVPVSPQTGQDIKKNGHSPVNFYQKSPNSTPPVLPRSRISPVANVLAIQKAKERLEAIKYARTPSMTASKAAGRVAHVNTKLLAAAPEKIIEKPAPPVLEPTSTKISYNLRMNYYNMMVKQCLVIYPSCEDAWDRAQTEELAVFKKCTTPIIYKSSALLTINKLKKEAVESGNADESVARNKTISHDVILGGRKAQKTSWSVNKKIKTEEKSTAYTFETASSSNAYKMIYDCILTEEQLKSNGFPRPVDGPGRAKIYTAKRSKPPKEDERYCSRCSKIFNLAEFDEPAVDSCIYHGKSTGYRRGFADNLHRCCQQPAGTPGCCYANYHVTDYADYDNLTGYVTTIDPPEDYVPTKKDIFALVIITYIFHE
jgi:RNA exonuclease 1